MKIERGTAQVVDAQTRAGDPFYYAAQRSKGCDWFRGWVTITIVEPNGGERDVPYPCKRCHKED